MIATRQRHPWLNGPYLPLPLPLLSLTLKIEGVSFGLGMWMKLFVEKYHRARKFGGSGMSDTQPYPYETRLNIYYKPLEIVEEKQLSDDCKFQWDNQTLCQRNVSVVRF